MSVALDELRKLNDHGDFGILESGSRKFRVAGPSKGTFFVQIENRDTKQLLERDGIDIQKLEEYVIQFFNEDMSFLHEFQSPSMAKWPFFILAFFVIGFVYVFTT